MKFQILNLKSCMVVAGILLLASCDKSNEQSNLTESQVLSTEVAFSNADEGADIGTTVANNADASGQLAGAREEGEHYLFGFHRWDDRLKCATITIERDTASTKEWPIGTITISFDSATCSNRGVVRSGEIVIHFSGHRYSPGATRSISFNAYKRNKHEIDGTYTITNVSVSDTSYLKFEVVLVGGKITFPDGSTITREQDITHEWIRTSNPLNDEWLRLAGGTAHGTGRRGHSYDMQIIKDILVKRSCEINDDICIPVSGEKKVKTDSKEFDIDYGDGTCDNIITMTVNGAQKNITVTSDGD